MAVLSEKDIFTPFIGKSVLKDVFDELSQHNGADNYLICNVDYIDDSHYCERFGVTDRVKWKWKYCGVDYTIYLTVEDGVIKDGHLYKSKEGGGGHGRPSSCVLAPTQQELRIARRVLDFVTE